MVTGISDSRLDTHSLTELISLTTPPITMLESVMEIRKKTRQDRMCAQNKLLYHVQSNYTNHGKKTKKKNNQKIVKTSWKS